MYDITTRYNTTRTGYTVRRPCAYTHTCTYVRIYIYCRQHNVFGNGGKRTFKRTAAAADARTPHETITVYVLRILMDSVAAAAAAAVEHE